MVVADVVNGVMWQSGLVSDLGMQQNVSVIFLDSYSVINFDRKSNVSRITKHIDFKYTFPVM